MNPYQYYVPQQYYPFYGENEQMNTFREPLQAQGVERRLNSLERQNENQVRELNRLSGEIVRLNKEIQRLNGDINRMNHELTRLSDVNGRQSRHLNRLNQRLRVVENRLTIPFTPTEGGF